HTQVSSFSEKYKNQRDDIIEYFNARDLEKRKEAEKEKKEVDAKIAEEKRLSDARVLHGSFPPAVDSETAMGTMLDIPGTTSVVFNPDNNVFYVGSGGTNSIVMLDANNYNKIGEVTPPECRGDGCEHDPVSTLALSPDRRTLYATSLVKDSFSIIDLASNVIAGNIPVGKMPKHMVLSPDGSLAWVLNELDNSISVIELKSRKVIREVKLPGKYDAYSSNFNFRPIAISHSGKLFAAYDTLESKLLIIDAKTFQIRGAGFNLDMDNATSLVFSMDDDSLWLSGREGVEQVDARSGGVLHSYSWCGDKFRKSDILFTLLDPEQSQLLLTANGDGGVYLVLYDLKTRSNIGQYPTSDDYGFPMLNLKDGTVMQGNHAHLQIANKNKSLATDPAATWLCERGGVGHESGYFN
ncbi:TPA: YncE family protein, partial [Citrobacter farmeri]|nr:YncE family protein [Citrobacter farmeri]